MMTSSWMRPVIGRSTSRFLSSIHTREGQQQRHTAVRKKKLNKINIAFYNRISVKYGRPGSDSRPPAPAVHRNRVSETAISAAGASNDRGLLGKITSKLAVPL